MATIEEVAKEAGVSVATVSRVLNNKSPVSINARIKVENAIKKLKYEPNMLGRNLRRSESRMILALLPSISNPFYASIIQGIEDIAVENNYGVLLCETSSKSEREMLYFNLLKQKLADGVISLDPTIDKNNLKEIGIRYPFIQCCEYDEDLNIPYVAIDNKLAAYKAVKHLISIGHKNIALINSDEKFLYARLRKEGYIEALQENNIEVDEKLMINCDLDFESGKKAMKQLLKSNESLTAVFAVADILAIGAIKAIKEANYRVPDDIAVVGFDNIPMANMIDPALTTIAQPMYQIGCTACKMLIKKINNKDETIENSILGFELIIRESTMK
ncbi:LacI family transcriptional regulator [Caloramator sp. E03]|uniref:LacI family DNA-binding transcriptional regulator n=1 Tax=Caloramator sp. E03 TaxID=2576307 RepID=UPI0011109336|nr:LacI family DNA-binding transcriptional regulator [Caloramator sp. E03]QCX33231.1 LacI family transcriptional regulator [Caloramator sp. E03]